jgi:hypothetical protein
MQAAEDRYWRDASERLHGPAKRSIFSEREVRPVKVVAGPATTDR